ncbi:unnamed protein product [Withania somnifera]
MKSLLLRENFYLLLLLSLYSIHLCLGATDTITTTHFLKDGDVNITSPGGIFEIGFFSPGNSKNRYVGMWYKNMSVRTVVWVANREAPLSSGSGILKIIKPGLLVLLNGTNNVVWSTNTSRSVQNPVAQLLDSGNLVVKEAGDDSPRNYLWQSFDHPTDTLLAGMKLGRNFVTGREVYLSSWKNEEDPAPGDSTYHCDPSGYPQNILKKGSDVVYRSGPWNAEVYFGYKLTSSVLVRLTLSHNGVLQVWTWGDANKGWVPFLLIPADNCDMYKLCGTYGSCNSQDSPVCGCLDKFVPNNADTWKKNDWSGGCVRRTGLNCIIGDIFLKYSHIKLPDTRNSWSNVTMTLEECRNICSKNCSCRAYSNSDILNGGSGCLLWSEDLLDIRQGPNGGQDIYIRMAASESDSPEQSNGNIGNVLFWILPLSVGLMLVLLSLLIYHRRRKKALELKNKDDAKIKVLSWPKRFHIINGIARGLMYLHQDSQLRIIHRDLKANNILLDKDMNPKISDFGIAKICEEDALGAKTNRVVGTYGYLSPEYALHGRYSVKSDVFSFGILILEIVSGKSNRRFSHPDYNLNLLGHAWKLYKEGRSAELLDEYLADSCSTPEVERSICVGLLCVQQCPEDRPSMSSAVMMLNNEGVLPQAKRPGFYIEKDAPDGELYAESTVSETPITILAAR